MANALNILCFGPAREATGESKLAFATDLPCSVAQLRQRLADHFPKLGGTEHIRIAVDQEYADDALTIAGHEEIAIILPVSGG